MFISRVEFDEKKKWSAKKKILDVKKKKSTKIILADFEVYNVRREHQGLAKSNLASNFTSPSFEVSDFPPKIRRMYEKNRL